MQGLFRLYHGRLWQWRGRMARDRAAQDEPLFLSAASKVDLSGTRVMIARVILLN